MTVTAPVKVKDNRHIVVSSNSMLKRAENIEARVGVGARGMILAMEKERLLLKFLPGSNEAIEIWVDKTYFSNRFTAADERYPGY